MRETAVKPDLSQEKLLRAKIEDRDYITRPFYL